MQRVSVVGISGAGKSTLAARLAERMGAPHIELDSIRHQPGWTELPDEAFRREVEERTRAERWVVDGNYPMVRDIIWSRADTVVWLDLPRHVVMRRIVLRTLRRVLFRVQLWNGNRERWVNLTSIDPERSVVAWAWWKHGESRALYQRLMRQSESPRIVRLADDTAVESFTASI